MSLAPRSRARWMAPLLVAVVTGCAAARPPSPSPPSPPSNPPAVERPEALDGGTGGPTAGDGSASAEVADAKAPATAPAREALEMPPAPPEGSLPAPAVFAKLATATSLEVQDEGVGLGGSYDVVIRLDLAGDTYKVRAKFSRAPASVGESMHDPTAPRESAFKCTCTIDRSCPCEGANVARKTGAVAAPVVHDFLRALATHGFPKPPTPGTMGKIESGWTDDYPRGHVAVVLPGEQAPLHFSFWDQKRAWRFNGKTLSEEPAPSRTSVRISHPYTWEFYRRLLVEAGLSTWFQERSSTTPGP